MSTHGQFDYIPDWGVANTSIEVPKNGTLKVYSFPLCIPGFIVVVASCATKLLLVKTAIHKQDPAVLPYQCRIGIGVVPCNIGCEGFARPTNIGQNKMVIQYHCRLLKHVSMHTYARLIYLYIYIYIDR